MPMSSHGSLHQFATLRLKTYILARKERELLVACRPPRGLTPLKKFGWGSVGSNPPSSTCLGWCMMPVACLRSWFCGAPVWCMLSGCARQRTQATLQVASRTLPI